MRNRKIGSFSIPAQLIEDTPDAVQGVMARCIVIRCEMMWERRAFDYTALSDDFATVAEGEMIPRYAVAIQEGGNVEFRRIE